MASPNSDRSRAQAASAPSAVIHAFPASRRAAARQARGSRPKQDPAFAAIAEHRRADAAFAKAVSRLDRAAAIVRRKHGLRPGLLISWRNYSAIGGSEIEKARDVFLQLPGISRRAIWREYRDAKARVRQQRRAQQQWDKRTGLVRLQREYDLADAAEEKAARKVAKTKPTTLAGAAALLDHAGISENFCARDNYETAIVRAVIEMLRAMPEPGAAKRAA